MRDREIGLFAIGAADCGQSWLQLDGGLMKNATAYALDKAEQFAKMGSDIANLKSNLTGLAKDTRRAVRKGRHAIEEFVDEATLCVKKQPLKAIGFTFGAGMAIGALTGWFATRR
jgi:ElaB/YqjD/DUF883 family membrane-anchored ribosome-binding protein